MSSGFGASAAVIGQNLDITVNIMQVLAIMIGLCLFLGAIFQLKRYGESRSMMSQQYTIWGPLAMMLSGVCFLVLPVATGTILGAFWGHDNVLPIAYTGSTQHDIDVYVPVVLMFIRVVGIGAIMRSLSMLAKSGGHGGQPGTIGKSLIHMFGGLLCVHALGTVHLLKFFFNINM